MSATKELQVLLAEDNAADVLLLKEGLSTCAPCRFTVIGNGDQVFEFLNRCTGRESEGRPDLIVLDLNLPGRDGIQVLNFIRGHAEFKDMVVAVVSSSPEYMIRQYAGKADCYIIKPSDLEEFLAIGRTLVDCFDRCQQTRRQSAGSDR